MCGSLYNTYEFPDMDALALMRLLKEQLNPDTLDVSLNTHLNVRPGAPIPTIIPVDGAAHSILATWWLKLQQQQATWEPDTQWKTFNCKSTKILQSAMHTIKPVSRRTLVISEGFHEWQPIYPGNRRFTELSPAEQMAPPTPMAKQCYLIKPEQGLCRFGALSKRWDTNTYSTGIITLPSHKGFAEIHRQSFPLVIEPDEVSSWLNPRIPTQLFDPLFQTTDFRETWLATPVVGPLDNNPMGPTVRLRPERKHQH